MDSTVNQYDGNEVLNYTAITKATAAIRAINHPLRRQILRLLNENRRMIVRDIYVNLRLDEVFVSQQLAILRREKIVVTERKGKEIFYSLNYNRIAKIVAFIGTTDDASRP
jgi:DNA-binding transcriptional ArsR family regulator